MENKIFRQRYQIERTLFRRKSGNFYLVVDLKSNEEKENLSLNFRRKMMKIVRLDPDDGVESVREAQILSKLDNEHIVKFFESFLENDFLCIVMEFCDGGDLDQRLKELKKQNEILDENQIVEWLIQILIAVEYLHKSRILHRNLRAKNIFLKNNRIKLAGFHSTSATTFIGTPVLMAPEVLKNEGYEEKSDVWSIGCLLYEMCTFQHAFDGKGLMNVVCKVVNGKTPDLPKIYSKELNDLLKKMLIKSANLRPNASEVLTNRIFVVSNLSRPSPRVEPLTPKSETMSTNLISFGENFPPPLLKRRKMAKPFLSGIRSTTDRTVSIDRYELQRPRTPTNGRPNQIVDRHEYPPIRQTRLLVAEPKFARSASKDRVRLDTFAQRTRIDEIKEKGDAKHFSSSSTIRTAMAENDEQQIYGKRYRIEKKLGAGNFGTAYLVTDLKAKTEQKVLKVVRLGEMDPDESVESVREAQLLSKLQNEHIVKFFESFLENDCLCIVTEFCEGGDLDQRLKELKKQNQILDENQIVEWLIQILIAVQYMHKSRILHRDLKARNIFLKNNQIKIGDFGISRVLVGTMDVATTFTGTPYYMSPEVMKHDGYEAKSDIWSVGCLLYEMCTFQHAFDGKGLMNVIYKVVEGKAPEIPKKYSKSLNDLLKKMFIKDPKMRPSANDILKTDFIMEHRQRTKLMGSLESTISGKTRALEINDELQKPMNYRQMRDENVRIRNKDYPVYEYDEEEEKSKTTNVDEQEEEEEQTLKSSNTFNSASREAILARRIQQSDDRAQMFNQAIRANAIEAQQQQRARNAEQQVKVNPIDYDSRPITPMRTSYGQVAGRYANDDETSTNNDRSPIRQQRVNSSSQRSTMNSMSRTIDPRHAAKGKNDAKPMSPSQTIGTSTGRQKTFVDDNAATLKDNPSKDAYGPMAKEKKIDDLRMKAIRGLGEQDFQRVYDYYVQQQTALKTNPDLDEAKISQGAKAMVKNPGALFLVEQLVFLEMH